MKTAHVVFRFFHEKKKASFLRKDAADQQPSTEHNTKGGGG